MNPDPTSPAAAGPAAHIATWLKRQTFHHAQFADLKALVAAKQAAGLTISLCIPTLNEEKTIGKEVVLFKSELMTRHPLIDEMAVIDSGSTDATCDVARAHGADVYTARDILPEHGERRGKGENLWKAVYQLRGDIIVYVDADIRNIHPRFVYGLVGPLILHPHIQYVKAFYDRPLSLAKGVRASGGGRVTEILIRPLFSLFRPELSALIQPLSGEYAARRAVLEAIPFPVGYGVETAHLMDVYARWGLDALAQTDMDRRVHRNQATRDLGRMAFGILQTFLPRVRALTAGEPPFDPRPILRQFQSRDNEYEQVEHEILEFERPPMITLPEYRRKTGRGA